MKQFSLFTAIAVSFSTLSAQIVSDSVSLGAGYAQQSYYSLLNGEVANVNNGNWDLAFDASAFGSSIHINDQAGLLLYTYPDGDTSDWSSLDTSGLSGWSAQYNSDYSWSLGAFEQNMNLNDPTDLGWGVYSTITHAVTGDSIYVIRLANGDWKKLWIQDLFGGAYHFRYADLNGSNEVNAQLDKANYNGKNFGYYSLENDQEIDREPAKTSWDLVFSKYITELAPQVYYGVTGVLQNNEVSAAKAHPVNDPFTYASYGSHNFHDFTNSVGYDWKYFDMGSFAYVVEDSMCFFVNDVPGNIWRVTFTAFEGSGTGKIVFSKEMIAAAPPIGIEENKSAGSFGLYPNPAASEVNILYTAGNEQVNVNVFTLTGKQVAAYTFNGQGFNKQVISLDGFGAGVYMVALNRGTSQEIRKLIIQ